jgi:hypothetical protein
MVIGRLFINSLGPEPMLRIMLGRDLHRNRGSSIQCLYVNICSQYGLLGSEEKIYLGDCDIGLGEKIVALSLEVIIFCYVDFHDQVSARAPAFALIAFARDSQVLARVYPLGYIYFFSGGNSCHADTLAGTAGVSYDLAATFTFRTHHLDGHRPLPVVNVPLAAACRALDRAGARLTLAPVTGRASTSKRFVEKRITFWRN